MLRACWRGGGCRTSCTLRNKKVEKYLCLYFPSHARWLAESKYNIWALGLLVGSQISFPFFFALLRYMSCKFVERLIWLKVQWRMLYAVKFLVYFFSLIKNMYDHKRNGFFLISSCFLPFLVLYHFRDSSQLGFLHETVLPLIFRFYKI